MNRHDDLIAQLEGYLDEFEGATPLPDVVRNAVRRQVPTTRQLGALPWPMRRNTIGLPVPAGVAVLVAAVAVAVLGISLVPRLNIGSNPSSRPTPSPTPVPLIRSDFPLPAGTYVADQVMTTTPITLTLPANWVALEDKVGSALLIKTEGGKAFGVAHNTSMLGIFVVDGVFADPCHDASPQPASADTNQLISQLSHAKGMQLGPTGVVETTLGGLPAKVFDLINTIDQNTCVAKPFNQWTFAGYGGVPSPNGNGEPGRQRIWIVQVNGTRLLVDAQGLDATATYYSASDVAELLQTVQSIRFE